MRTDPALVCNKFKFIQITIIPEIFLLNNNLIIYNTSIIHTKYGNKQWIMNCPNFHANRKYVTIDTVIRINLIHTAHSTQAAHTRTPFASVSFPFCVLWTASFALLFFAHTHHTTIIFITATESHNPYVPMCLMNLFVKFSNLMAYCSVWRLTTDDINLGCIWILFGTHTHGAQRRLCIF